MSPVLTSLGHCLASSAFGDPSGHRKMSSPAPAAIVASQFAIPVVPTSYAELLQRFRTRWQTPCCFLPLLGKVISFIPRYTHQNPVAVRSRLTLLASSAGCLGVRWFRSHVLCTVCTGYPYGVGSPSRPWVPLGNPEHWGRRSYPRGGCGFSWL